MPHEKRSPPMFNDLSGAVMLVDAAKKLEMAAQSQVDAIGAIIDAQNEVSLLTQKTWKLPTEL